MKITFKPTKDLERNNKNFINVVHMLMWVNYLSNELENAQKKLTPYISIDYTEKTKKDFSGLVEKSEINNLRFIDKK